MRNLPPPFFTPIAPDPATNDRLATWQSELEKLSSEHILRWAFDVFDRQIAFAPSWKEEDLVIQSLLERIPRDVPVEDRIHPLLLPETWTPLRPHEVAAKTFDGRKASVNLWARFHLEHLCKLFEKTVGRYRVWIVSARREHDTVLRSMPILSWNERFGVLRLAPLAHWKKECVQAKIRHDAAPGSPDAANFNEIMAPALF